MAIVMLSAFNEAILNCLTRFIMLKTGFGSPSAWTFLHWSPFAKAIFVSITL